MSAGTSPNGPVVVMDGQGRVLRIIPADEALAASRAREAQKPRRNQRPIRAAVAAAVARANAATAKRTTESEPGEASR
jgi:hypothetical protein